MEGCVHGRVCGFVLNDLKHSTVAVLNTVSQPGDFGFKRSVLGLGSRRRWHLHRVHIPSSFVLSRHFMFTLCLVL